ncbi:MAG: hypothetical protein ACU0BF_01725 [Paracoccaceae bacterium]
MPDVTPAEKLEELRRELRMRQRVYPRQIQLGRMTQADADRRIAVLEAVAADYDTLPLFDETAR